MLSDLEKILLFQGTRPEFPKALLENAETYQIKKGDFLFNEGEDAKGMYIVLSGQLEVVSKGKGDKFNVLANLGPEAFFGEIGMISGKKT